MADKKEFSNEISSPYLDEIYDYALKNGVLGGKLEPGEGYFIFMYQHLKNIVITSTK